MRTVEDTPTRPADYAALTGAFVPASAAVGRAARRTPEPIRETELLPIGPATSSLAKTITREKVETWVRRPFVAEQDGGEAHPRGKGMRHAIGELLTCSRCAGTWAALCLVALRLRAPGVGRAATAVGCASAVHDIAQVFFSEATAAANRQAAGATTAATIRDRLTA